MTVYGDLENYESDRGRTPTSVPDVFNNRKFFGGGNIHDFENISGTYISQKLLDVIAERGTPNTLYIGRLQGRMIMRLYDAQGNIYIANYITGGTSAHKSPENITYKTGWTDKYHISSSYPEEGTRGAPMYAATNVNG